VPPASQLRVLWGQQAGCALEQAPRQSHAVLLCISPWTHERKHACAFFYAHNRHTHTQRTHTHTQTQLGAGARGLGPGAGVQLGPGWTVVHAWNQGLMRALQDLTKADGFSGGRRPAVPGPGGPSWFEVVCLVLLRCGECCARAHVDVAASVLQVGGHSWAAQLARCFHPPLA